MNEPGPFDRILDSSASRDSNARAILIGMGILGLLLLVIVFMNPFGGDDDSNEGGSVVQPGSGAPSTTGATNGNTSRTTSNARLPKAPEGFEVLSKIYTLEKPKGVNGPYSLTVNLAAPANDGRNLALYTNKSGKWERVATGTLVNNGTAVAGAVQDMPANVAVLRRVATAVSISGWLPAGAQPEPAALDLLGAISPVDYHPAPDGGIIGSATSLPAGRGNVVPVVRASTQAEVDSLNSILSSPAQRDAHIAGLVQLSLQPGNAGVEIDYRQLNPARKADFTAFVAVLSDRLHQATKSLTVTLPAPVKAGVSWDTGAYDWEELSRRADTIKLVVDPDPSTYYKRMDETLGYLKGKVDLKKISLVVGRQSYEKGTDGLRALTLREGLTLASAIEVRTTSAITPNSSVVIVGKNIFQDDGASGLRWDDAAFAVSFSYPGRGGQRTVWLENNLSIAFKLDMARRYGLGGVSLEDVSIDPNASNIWDPVRVFAETGNIGLVAPNGVLLRPFWKIQAGSSEVGNKGNIVWKAPAQPGAYDVSLVVSDGVIRAEQKIVLTVGNAAGTPVAGATPAGTARPSTTGTPATNSSGGPVTTSTRPPASATPRP